MIVKYKQLIIGVVIGVVFAGAGCVFAENTNITNNGGPEYAFTHETGQDPAKNLISVIDNANSTLDIAIYSLTKSEIVDAILNAKKRGVTVRIISDKAEVKNSTQAAAFKKLQAAGIPIKINRHSGLMHLKVTVADKSVVTTGSFNYSQSASTDNDEVIVTLRNADLAKGWDDHFEQMWTDQKGFVDYTT